MNIRRTRGLVLAAVAIGSTVAASGTATAATTPSAVSYSTVVPAPENAKRSGTGYSLGSGTAIAAGPGSADIAGYLAAILRRQTGYPLPVVGVSNHPVGITLTLSGAPSSVGDHGYQLDVDASGVTIRQPRGRAVRQRADPAPAAAGRRGQHPPGTGSMAGGRRAHRGQAALRIPRRHARGRGISSRSAWSSGTSTSSPSTSCTTSICTSQMTSAGRSPSTDYRA